MNATQPPRSPWWVRFGVPIVMAIWATGQLFVVQTRGLNSWRGGGFGMYAGFHPVQSDAWVRTDDEKPKRFWKRDRDQSELFRIIRPHLTFPREDRLREALKQYAAEGKGDHEVEITSPSLDLNALVLSRKTLLKVSSRETVSGDQP